MLSARQQARALLEEARVSGEREGREQNRRLILQTQDEVRAIGKESKERAEQIALTKGVRMEVAVGRIVEIITAAGETER